MVRNISISIILMCRLWNVAHVFSCCFKYPRTYFMCFWLVLCKLTWKAWLWKEWERMEEDCSIISWRLEQKCGNHYPMVSILQWSRPAPSGDLLFFCRRKCMIEESAWYCVIVINVPLAFLLNYFQRIAFFLVNMHLLMT